MIASDFRHSLRMLVKQRGFTLVAVLTLAIALASNTAIFSVVNAILLRPLPYANPDRLVNITGVSRIDGDTFPRARCAKRKRRRGGASCACSDMS